MRSALEYCPTSYLGCAAVLPEVSDSKCARVLNQDLIDAILMTDADAPGFSEAEYADSTSLATALMARLSQTGTKTIAGYTGNAAIRLVTVWDATQPSTEPGFMTDNDGTKRAKASEKAFEGVDYNSSPENVVFHNKLMCKGKFRIWVLSGGYMKGGKDGIIAGYTAWEGITDNSDRPTEAINYRFTYKSVLLLPKVARPAIL